MTRAALRLALALVALFPGPARAQQAAPVVADAPRATRATLQSRLEAIAAVRAGRVGIAVLDPRDGRPFLVHGDEPFPMASTVKVAVAATYLDEVRRHRRSLERMIGLDERWRVGSDGIAKLMPHPGVRLSAANLIELMLRVSDNTATDMLIADLGGVPAVQRWLGRNRVGGVRIDRTIARLVLDNMGLPPIEGKTAAETLWASPPPSEDAQARAAAMFDSDPRDNATPLGMATFLRRLDTDLLDGERRAFLFDVMARCLTGADRLRALLPADTRVEHKTGTLEGISDDVGIIRLPDRRPLVIAVFTRGIADGKERAQIIAEAGKAAYDAFAGEP